MLKKVRNAFSVIAVICLAAGFVLADDTAAKTTKSAEKTSCSMAAKASCSANAQAKASCSASAKASCTAKAADAKCCAGHETAQAKADTKAVKAAKKSKDDSR